MFLGLPITGLTVGDPGSLKGGEAVAEDLVGIRGTTNSGVLKLALE